MSSEASLQRVRSELEREREMLQSQLAELGQGDSARLDYDTNFADSSQVTAERGEVAALSASLEEALAEVEHALSKIDKGTFGICERCNNEISHARLEAMPTGRCCIDCASR